MLGEDPRENRLAEWFRGLTMGVRIQIIMFGVVSLALLGGGAIALIEEPNILLPALGPDAEPVPGEPKREVSKDVTKDWRRAEAMTEPSKKPEMAAEGKGEVEALRKLVAMDPKDAGSWDKLGKSLFSSGQNAEAVRAFQRALELKPGTAEILANLGVTLKTSGEMTEYEKIVQSLALVDAKLARDLMEFSPAKTGTAEAPPVAVGATTKITEEATAGKPSESGEMGALRKLVAMDAKDADSWDRLGKALFLEKSYDEAMSCFDKSLELKPEVAEVWANLGVTAKSKGDAGVYAKVLEKLGAMNPKLGKELEAFQPEPAK